MHANIRERTGKQKKMRLVLKEQKKVWLPKNQKNEIGPHLAGSCAGFNFEVDKRAMEAGN